MYYGCIFLTVILFIIVLIISVELTVVTDELNRLPSNIYTELLDFTISDLTFAVIILIFLLGFIISLGILLYYKGTLDTNVVAPDAPVSGYRSSIFIYSFIAIIMVGLLIVAAITFDSRSELNLFLKAFGTVVTVDNVSTINDSISRELISLVLSIAGFFLALFILICYASHI